MTAPVRVHGEDGEYVLVSATDFKDLDVAAHVGDIERVRDMLQDLRPPSLPATAQQTRTPGLRSLL